MRISFCWFRSFRISSFVILLKTREMLGWNPERIDICMNGSSLFLSGSSSFHFACSRSWLLILIFDSDETRTSCTKWEKNQSHFSSDHPRCVRERNDKQTVKILSHFDMKTFMVSSFDWLIPFTATSAEQILMLKLHDDVLHLHMRARLIGWNSQLTFLSEPIQRQVFLT